MNKILKYKRDSSYLDGDGSMSADDFSASAAKDTSKDVSKIKNEHTAGKLGKFAKGFEGAQSALKMFSFAGKMLDVIPDALGMSTDIVNQTSADRAGFGGGNKLSASAQKILGFKFMSMFGNDKMKEAQKSQYINTIGSGYTASVQDINAAQDIGGQNILFGKEKARTFLNTANVQNALIDQIGQQTELAKANGSGQLYQMQNMMNYQGFTPKLLAKNGAKFPELDVARNIISKKKKDISKYQLGGKIIDPSKNIIPDGALHKNRNHLSEHNDELRDQITEKGIPVVSENADGTITQHAEVEVGEVIFNLENTKIIEDYWQQYKETGDDSIAIECGKFLTKELLRNTVDKAGIKKNIE